MKTLLHTLTLSLLLAGSLAVQAQDAPVEKIATLRGDVTLAEQLPTGRIAKEINTDIRQQRNYPMQPPVIPHQTRDYQVDLKSNKCLSCHSRQRTEDSQAPMVSVTHFMDRDGNFLADVSPRRYFCDQCHVSQTDAKPLVENTFVDMYQLMREKQ